VAGAADEWVAARGVAGGGGQEPEELATQVVDVLGVLAGIPGAATIAGREVQVPVAAKRERAAVVIRVRGVVDPEEDAARARGYVRRRVLVVVLDDVVVAVGVRVVDVEAAIAPGAAGPELRVERQAQQALFAATAVG
jgi:hypothetical protein